MKHLNTLCKSFCILLLFSSLSLHSQGELFPVWVISFSSQYSDSDYSANQALFSPNVYPYYGDSPFAWSSETADDQREFLELGYSMPVRADSIHIYETFNGGAVDTVYVRNPSTGDWDVVYEAEVDTITESRILRIGFPRLEVGTSAIRIAINSPAVPDWNEIDAVALIDSQAEHVASLGSHTSELDLVFGDNQGYALSGELAAGLPWGADIQSDGKIVVYYQFGGEGALYRFDTNGSLDTTFNSIHTPFRGRSLVINEADEIFVGEAGTVHKFNADGTLVEGFNQSDFLGARLYGMSFQSDGKLLAAGINFGTGLTVGRVNTDGTLDSTFGEGGLILGNGIFDSGWARAAKELSDGSIMVQSWTTANSPSHQMMIKFTPDGVLDTSFGDQGIFRVDTTGYLSRTGNDFVELPDGKLLTVVQGFTVRQETTADVIRLNADGTLDDSFGTNGVVSVDIKNLTDGGTAILEANRPSFLYLPESDEILLNLSVAPDSLSSEGFGLIRMSGDGVFDEEYGEDGIAYASLSGSSVSFQSILTNVDGYVIKLGECTSVVGKELALVHFLEEGVVSSDTDVNVLGAISLYPNPVLDRTELVLDLESTSVLDIRLHSYDGKPLKQICTRQVFPSGESRMILDMDSSHLPGVYFISISENDNVTIKKMIKL